MRWSMILLLACAVSLAGCADDGDNDDTETDDGMDDGAGDGGNMTIEREEVDLSISANGVGPVTFSYDKDRLEAPQNATVTLTLSNDDTNPAISHDWYFPNAAAQTATIAPGETDTITFNVDLPPGEYTFWCTIGNHRESGMEGTFVVT